jgi:hypothetical protein
MSHQRALIFFLGALAVFTCGADGAHAQGVSTCVKILWDFVGKPLTGVMVQKGGGLLFDHFAGKVKESGEVVVTPDDIQTLSREYGQRRISECELRRQFEVMYSGTSAPYGQPSPSNRGPSPEYGNAPPPYGGSPAYDAPSAYAGPPHGGFSAQAFCSITGAVGFAGGLPYPQQALAAAVSNCIAQGGVPQCCEHSARLVVGGGLR